MSLIRYLLVGVVNTVVGLGIIYLAIFSVYGRYNHADYRLISRRTIEALKEFGAVNLFLRGIIPQLGFSHTIVYYERAERSAGESQYPLKNALLGLVGDHIHL
jgi:hypothetical protein